MKNEIIRDRDVLGLEKPTNQLKRGKRKSNIGSWILIFIMIVIAALVLYFIDK